MLDIIDNGSSLSRFADRETAREMNKMERRTTTTVATETTKRERRARRAKTRASKTDKDATAIKSGNSRLFMRMQIPTPSQAASDDYLTIGLEQMEQELLSCQRDLARNGRYDKVDASKILGRIEELNSEIEVRRKEITAFKQRKSRIEEIISTIKLNKRLLRTSKTDSAAENQIREEISTLKSRLKVERSAMLPVKTLKAKVDHARKAAKKSKNAESNSKYSRLKAILREKEDLHTGRATETDVTDSPYVNFHIKEIARMEPGIKNIELRMKALVYRKQYQDARAQEEYNSLSEKLEKAKHELEEQEKLLSDAEADHMEMRGDIKRRTRHLCDLLVARKKAYACSDNDDDKRSKIAREIEALQHEFEIITRGRAKNKSVLKMISHSFIGRDGALSKSATSSSPTAAPRAKLGA